MCAVNQTILLDLHKMARNAGPSVAQIEKLVGLMEARSNSHLATGHARTANARTRMRTGWEEIGRVLNSDGNGCIKDWKQWAKYWKDKKASVKRKANTAEAARRKTGGGVDEEVVELTEIEQRILTIAGGISFATGDRNVSINPFPEQENEAPQPTALETDSAQSESILLQNPGPSGCQDVLIFSENALQWDTVAANIGEGSVQDILESPPVAPPMATPGSRAAGTIQDEDETMSFSEGGRVPERRSVVESPAASTTRSVNGGAARRRISVATPRRCERSSLPLQSGVCVSPRRGRSDFRGTSARGVSEAARRRLPRRSPPSQRRSEVASLTERFIAIEERRVDAENTTARAQEMFPQGHLKMAEAIDKLADTVNITAHKIIEAIQHHRPSIV